MKNLNTLLIALMSVALMSCGNKDDKKDGKNNEGDKKNSSKEDLSNKEPKKACDCYELAADEMNKIFDLTIAEIQKNPKVVQKMQEKVSKIMSSNTCMKLMEQAQKEYKSLDEFQENCPAFQKMQEMAMRAQKDFGNMDTENDTLQ
jgi:hypothetical protein